MEPVELAELVGPREVVEPREVVVEPAEPVELALGQTRPTQG